MRELPLIDPSLHRELRTIESAQGPKVVLDGREVCCCARTTTSVSRAISGCATPPRTPPNTGEPARVRRSS